MLIATKTTGGRAREKKVRESQFEVARHHNNHVRPSMLETIILFRIKKGNNELTTLHNWHNSSRFPLKKYQSAIIITMQRIETKKKHLKAKMPQQKKNEKEDEEKKERGKWKELDT